MIRRLLVILAVSACSTTKNTPTSDAKDAEMQSPRDGSSGTTTGDGAQSGAGNNAGKDGAVMSSDGSAPDANTGGMNDAGPAKRVVKTWVFQGGYGPFKVFELNRKTGALKQVGSEVDVGPSPSYVTTSADGRFLYIANEVDDGSNGGVTVASVNLASGAVTQIDHEPSAKGMVFTSLDPSGKYVLAASYNGAFASVYPIGMDGRIGAASDTETFTNGAQAHSVRVHASGKWTYVPLKGADRIAQLTFDANTGKLEPNSVSKELKTDAGDGPRHIAFHPNQKWAYVMNENSSRVSAYNVNQDGTLSLIESESSLPASYKGQNTGAHVLVSPNGKFVYGSNRGHDSIVVFAIDDKGALSLVEHESTRGQTPRNFDIDDRGELMVVANEDSGSLAVFSIGADGKLSPLGDLITKLQKPNAVAIYNVTE